MSYYCLISGDLSKEAFQVFYNRISEQRWPLYEKTKHINNIKINDLLIFYIGGKYSHCQSFAGEALVSKIEGLNEITIDPDSKNKIVKKYLFLKEIQTFKKPIKNLQFSETLKWSKMGEISSVRDVWHTKKIATTRSRSQNFFWSKKTGEKKTKNLIIVFLNKIFSSKSVLNKKKYITKKYNGRGELLKL